MKQAHEIIKKPIVSEHSFAEAGRGRYTFVVDIDSNKTDISLAFEKIFVVKLI